MTDALSFFLAWMLLSCEGGMIRSPATGHCAAVGTDDWFGY
jgi:hypothetical protein